MFELSRIPWRLKTANKSVSRMLRIGYFCVRNNIRALALRAVFRRAFAHFRFAAVTFAFVVSVFCSTVRAEIAHWINSRKVRFLFAIAFIAFFHSGRWHFTCGFSRARLEWAFYSFAGRGWRWVLTFCIAAFLSSSDIPFHLAIAPDRWNPLLSNPHCSHFMG